MLGIGPRSNLSVVLLLIEGPVSSNQSYPRENEPSLQLPPGALPPQWPPKRTRQEWWYVNKPLVIGLVGFVAFIVASWVIWNVPLVSVTHSFDGTVVTADHFINLPVHGNLTLLVESVQPALLCGSVGPGIPFIPNDTGFVFLDSSSIGTEATFSASYSDPSGTPMVAWISFAGTSCWESNTSGSFVISAPGQAWPGQIMFETPVPTTLYVNASYSYLAPLGALF